MMKLFPALIFLSLVAVTNNAHAYAATNLEIGTDRPGADYSNFEIAADYNICKLACENDDKCQAYTYVHPGVQGRNARCWLKAAAPNRVGSGCCYSGVKKITKEMGWDRPGGDFSNFDLPWWATVQDCAN